MKVTESLLIASQNNAKRTNHIKSRKDETQQNSRCRLCRDREETINHTISEYNKLVQKEYQAKLDSVDKVIPRKLCKKLKFDHSNKWYMHNTVSVLEKETCKPLWDFDVQMDHQISAR